MIRLVQFLDEDRHRRIGLSSEDSATLRLIKDFDSIYDLALAAIRTGESLSTLAQSSLSDERIDYDHAIQEQRLLPPLDHPDPARCLVSLTGLTHLGSAQSRDQMHAAVASGNVTDSIRIFQIGVDGGKPTPGEIGAQPEWAYKGDGRCIVAPEHPLRQPAFADDGGEEAEIAGLYVIADDGTPWRVGFALGNEFSDHVLERKNYLYLAHSKLRECSFGPELLVGTLPTSIHGEVHIQRDHATIWSGTFESGEAHMCHSIANLEHHHFKYDLFRRPGDVHIHFFGANSISFGSNIRTQQDDVFEIDVPLFGRPLRNPLKILSNQSLIQVRAL
jgi:hypothetical protein